MSQDVTAGAPHHDLISSIGKLVERHGRWSVLRALFTVSNKRRPRRLYPSELNDHLRRDLGLTPDQRHW